MLRVLKRLLFLLYIVLCVFVLAWCSYGQSTRAPRPELAIVRIFSHGTSGTVIATTPGRSWVLSCAHSYLDHKTDKPDPKARAARHLVDMYPQPTNATKVPHRLILHDHGLDLSLLEIDAGPFYYLPIAPAWYKLPQELWSVGFDRMKWPPTMKLAHVLRQTADITYTTEPPWHGRSGGALIDPQAGLLVGVVCAYTTPPLSKKPLNGVYVSLDAIHRFLARAWPLTNRQRAQQDWRPLLPGGPQLPFAPLCPT